ncbi:tRNA 2-thiouridine(34) synthase MnmA [bacterium (Candidatus Gribaldobacteria) CG08_land_8_20_14_0_20_39_15]|uniref:tRNA-specific 2-thiouridylase MnmA n=1 Tax=bacterium (Candidatus Gribaldobacteria) CG08_land_8_20_14_0_20_39_15 TaxID=2014273 RepID=A0A2M6XUS2_9BACT|nr:MAG: tRNA 2-thiouridine(34) synthase MnmA [bacterium (Candidatus Gribaldobacteria) CG08_land_8_20_14_0_20_39_15]
MKNNKLKIVVAMSGGVDSSVAAALLKQQGYDIVGIFMKFWKSSFDDKKNGGWNRCCAFEAQQRARAVARVLNIPFYVLNLEKQFKSKVVDYFLQEARAGRTPNPCVICNKEIKFGLLLDKAMAMGADFVATGHYARLLREILNPKSEILNKYKIQNLKSKTVFKILEAKDKNKDQSYFLWQLNQKQLSRILLPIGEIASKAKARDLARKFNLPVAQTKESQEICFVKDKVAYFFKQTIEPKKGKITTKQGKAIGQHQGLWFYTIGQRKGLNLSQGPWFVVDKDIKNNNLIVSKNEKDLLQKELIAENVNWISGQEPKLPLKIKAKIRYRSELASATVKEKIAAKKYKVVFSKPQRAITPGQSIVFYLLHRSPAVGGAKAGEASELLGGGIIELQIANLKMQN